MALFGALTFGFVGVSIAAEASNPAPNGGAALVGVLGGGLFGIAVIANVVFGLLGWLLTMRRGVLSCEMCRACVETV